MTDRLTEAHRAFIAALPTDGSWRQTGGIIRRIENEFGKNAIRGFGQSDLIEGYYREETRHRLTEAGQAVAASLKARAAL